MDVGVNQESEKAQQLCYKVTTGMLHTENCFITVLFPQCVLVNLMTSTWTEFYLLDF